MGLELDADDQLFLLETVIESVTLRLDHDDECDEPQEDPPWTICFQLCNTFSFEMKQEDEEKTEEIICPRTKECTVKFHSGKSCLFTANPSKFLQIVQDNPICVTVSAQYCDSPTPDVLARGEIEFDDTMIEELCTCLNEGSDNSETSCKGCYPLCDNKKLQVGVIKLYLRLSFYGKCILSEFKLLSGMDNILFKVQNEDERNKCFKCGKAKARALAGENSDGDVDSKECADDNTYWEETRGYQSNYLPGASPYNEETDLFKYGRGNKDPCYSSNYESSGRNANLTYSDGLFSTDFLRRSYCPSYGDQEKGLTRKSGLPNDIFGDSTRAFSLKNKASSESVDFRKIIGEEKLTYQPSEESRSYIVPIFDYCEKGYAIDERKVQKAPRLRAGPKRRQKAKAKKTDNFEAPGVKVGHKDCIKKLKNVPKKSGWMWPEKSKKSPSWKPGSVPKNIAEILNSSRLDAEGGKGDYVRKNSSKKDMKVNSLDKAGEEADDISPVMTSRSRTNTVADQDEQPSLHFKMCGGSYMISVNPAALGDKSKDRRNQNGLFMKLNRKEEDLDSPPSDLEIAFTTPRLTGCVPVELKESQFLDVCKVPGTSQSTDCRDDKEGGICANLIGGSGKESGVNGIDDKSKNDDKGYQSPLKEKDTKKRSPKNEKLMKTPSEGDTPKLIPWEEDPETAMGMLRGKVGRKLVF